MGVFLNEYQAQDIDFARQFHLAWCMGGEAGAMKFARRHMQSRKVKPDIYENWNWLRQRGYEMVNGEVRKALPSLPFAA